MKILQTLIFVLFTFALVAQEPTDNSLATVNQYQGFYIFIDCKPKQPYDYIQTVKVTFSMSGQMTAVKDKIVKKARKECPSANGIIINFNSGGADKADCIKFTTK